MNLTKEQEIFLDEEWDGTEWCPHCGAETGFLFNPMKQEHIICQNCGAELLPCSLCDCGRMCRDCKDGIRASLLHYNDMWNEEVNGSY